MFPHIVPPERGHCIMISAPQIAPSAHRLAKEKGSARKDRLPLCSVVPDRTFMRPGRGIPQRTSNRPGCLLSVLTALNHQRKAHSQGSLTFGKSRHFGQSRGPDELLIISRTRISHLHRVHSVKRSLISFRKSCSGAVDTWRASIAVGLS